MFKSVNAAVSPRREGVLMKTFLAVFALSGLLIPLTTQAATTITVTSTADSGPGSLRDAIATASSGDNIHFSVTEPLR